MVAPYLAVVVPRNAADKLQEKLVAAVSLLFPLDRLLSTTNRRLEVYLNKIFYKLTLSLKFISTAKPPCARVGDENSASTEAILQQIISIRDFMVM